MTPGISGYFVEFDSARNINARRRVQHLNGENLARCIVIENKTGLLLITFGDGTFAKDHGEDVGVGVVGDFQVGAPITQRAHVVGAAGRACQGPPRT